MDLKVSFVISIFVVLVLHQTYVESVSLRHGTEIRKLSNGEFWEADKKYLKNPPDMASLLKRDMARKFSQLLPSLKSFRNDIRSVKFDPDVNKDPKELILELGYPFESHTIQTKDGFLLGIFRIPHGKNNKTLPNEPRPAVFLQHGLLTSAADWLMNFENDSLAFVLADAGYDVWLGNSRGNTYSRRHISLSPTEDAFWDWSFDEMAKYDTPACIDYIINKTGNPKISYVGHSQGTIMAFAMFSTLPEYEKKVNLFIGLAPIISLDYVESPIKYLSMFPDFVLYDIFGKRDFLPNYEFIKFLADTVCDVTYIDIVCTNILFVIAGPDASNLNKTRLAVYLNHTPAGTSTRNMIHYSQWMREKRFAMYDFGSAAENNAHYGQPIPPAYNSEKITVPTVLFTATKDWLADPKDVVILKNTVKSIKSCHNFAAWNHLDFVYGMDAGKLCYQNVVKQLKTVL